MPRRRLTLACALGVVMTAGPVWAGRAETAPTFNSDVAAILFDKCVSCHRDGQVAPMALTTYAETRPWARAIKSKVVSREMPPWFADPRFGSFRNARGLSQDEVDAIVAWADGGAPEGDGMAPDLPVFHEGWSHTERPPDRVVDLPLELTLPPDGEIPYLIIWAEPPFEDDRFLEAVQMRPTNLEAVHHAAAFLRALPAGTRLGEAPAYPGGPVIPQPVALDETETDEDRRTRVSQSVFETVETEYLLTYLPGGGFHEFRPGVGKRIRTDRHLVFRMHYTATGRPETDRSALGFWFQQTPTHHAVVTQLAVDTHVVEGAELVADGARRAEIPVITPHDGDWAITAITAFTDDATLYAMSPHMHLRGADATYVLTYPDGTEEVLLSVPRYDFNWQLQYELAEPKKIPAGSTIKYVGHFDNSTANRYNPAPEREVYWGEQSWDEMFLPFMEYSIDKLDLSLETTSESDGDGQ